LGANEVEPPEPQIYSWASEPVVVEEVEEVPDLTREPMRINGWTVVSASNDILPSLDDTVSKKKRVRSR
ncbi:MAG TPA: hypothetical protein VMU77_08200, partial [Acidimicrobiales bacterium]|nr:hypothetical protein [Acidimicrobiales bacterium]